MMHGGVWNRGRATRATGKRKRGIGKRGEEEKRRREKGKRRSHHRETTCVSDVYMMSTEIEFRI